MRLQGVFGIVLVCATSSWNPAGAQGQELVNNGDFEIIALDETEQPILDDYGNTVPIGWHRSADGEPPPGGTPKTEQITDDSSGSGTNSAALNPVFGFGDPHSDWRSESFATTPTEILSFSFDFKFLGVTQFLDFQQFRIELRSHQDQETTMFVGEQTLYVSPVSYEISGQGLVAADFNDGQWHTLSFDREIPGIATGAAADGVWSDVRVSINAFTTLTEGQVRIDNVTVTRPITVSGDYNMNGIVDAADYTVWRDSDGMTGTGLAADGNGDEVIDEEDYALWVSQFGMQSQAVASATTAAVPEPGTWGLSLLLLAIASARRLAMRT